MKSILDHPIISQRYFFPDGIFVKDPFMVQSGNVQLACLYEKKESPLCIIYFHGNGEEVADYENSSLFSLQASILFAEYRGFGGSTGAPSLIAMMDDIDTLVEASGYDVEHIVFMGRSVGSIYAIEAVNRYPECAGLVIESGIADVAQRLLLRVDPAELGVSIDDLLDACKEHLDHENKLLEWEGKTLIMHTRNDDLVDVSHAYDLQSWAGEDASLCIFEYGNHNCVIGCNQTEYLVCMSGFLENCI